MPTGTDRAIEDALVRTGLKTGDHLGGHHRLVSSYSTVVDLVHGQMSYSASARASSSVKGMTLSTFDEDVVVPDFEIVQLPEHVYLSRHTRRFAHAAMNQDATLFVELCRLPEEVDLLGVPFSRWMSGGNFGELSLYAGPHPHRVQQD